MTDEEWFGYQLGETAGFFGRFGAEPDLAGKRVLDFGCGHGALSHHAAGRGAARVVGIDIDEGAVAFAQRHAPEGAEFVCGDVRDLTESFDVVLSKDTFEHVLDVGDVLGALRDRTAEDGELWLGFSPLFYSPWGGHTRMGPRVPWLHIAPHPGRPNPADVGLNGMTPARFRQAVRQAGLVFESVRYNSGDKRGIRVLSAIRRFRPLEPFATVSVYAVLRRSDVARNG